MNTYGPLTGYAFGDHKRMQHIAKAHQPALWDFVNSTFDEFALLGPEDKWDLFQSFVVLLWGIDKNYQTFKKVAKEMYQSMWVDSLERNIETFPE